MKKIFNTICLFMAVGCIVSCSKEMDAPNMGDNEPQLVDMTFSADGDEGGKTIIQNGTDIYFQENDAVVLPAAMKNGIRVQFFNGTESAGTVVTNASITTNRAKIKKLGKITPAPVPPYETIPGDYSISLTQKVRFAKGNLQYQASTGVNGNTAPYLASTTESDYISADLSVSGNKADWGYVASGNKYNSNTYGYYWTRTLGGMSSGKQTGNSFAIGYERNLLSGAVVGPNIPRDHALLITYGHAVRLVMIPKE